MRTCAHHLPGWQNTASVRTYRDAVVAISKSHEVHAQVPVDGETGWFWLDTWQQMYNVDPTAGSYSGPGAGRVVGGEANMWTEQVSALTLHARVWPRASAVAERLWSPASVNDSAAAAQRLATHRCRLAARGIPTGPIWADYCNIDLQDVTVAVADEYVVSHGLMASKLSLAGSGHKAESAVVA